MTHMKMKKLWDEFQQSHKDCCRLLFAMADLVGGAHQAFHLTPDPEERERKLATFAQAIRTDHRPDAFKQHFTRLFHLADTVAGEPRSMARKAGIPAPMVDNLIAHAQLSDEDRADLLENAEDRFGEMILRTVQVQA